MPLHLLFFTNILSFLTGVILASWQIAWPMIFIFAAILFGALFMIKEAGSWKIYFVAATAALSLLAGAFYYFQYEIYHQNQTKTKPTLSPLASEIRANVRDSFEKILPDERGAFLFDILFGGVEGLSKNFSRNLDLSGARFLTAIDGLHISIVIFIIFSALDFFLPRKLSFSLTFVFIFLFIALTGFSASAIRAALMASLVKLSQESGRLYAPENALTFAAFILTLINPKILVFDVGFHLSFLAILAILYIAPILRKGFLRAAAAPPQAGRLRQKIGASPIFKIFAESLLISLSVQIATAPILISRFQNFSLLAFLAGAFVVLPLPLILILGFFIALFALLSPFGLFPLTLLLSFLIIPFLEYLIFIINFSASHAISMNPALSPAAIIIYYGILFFVMYCFHQKSEN